MKEIVFILSSLCDPHYRKRVEEFVEQGYKVTVYGFKRRNQDMQTFPCSVNSMGEISNFNYYNRIAVYKKAFKKIAPECNGKLCFYSSLDVALFARLYIKSKYLYEICDLTELAIKNNIVRRLLVAANKYYINKSQLTIFTSEGFLDFYKNLSAEKYVVVPNKVSPHCPHFECVERSLENREKIRIGFVGMVRYETTYNFIKVCVENFPNIEMHIYGLYSDGDKYAGLVKSMMGKYENLFYHGKFRNPDELPDIYKEIDLLLCTYTPEPSVIYAEPNKLYEAIYFRCPIIVNSNTFLSRKVKRLGIGYSVNALNSSEVYDLLSGLSAEKYNELYLNCAKIPQSECLNINDEMFEKISDKF